MSRLLFVSEKLPLPDHASGDLRFFSLLKILTAISQVHLSIFGWPAQKAKLKETKFNHYQSLLSKHGIHLHLGHIPALLRQGNWEIIAFEFYHTARPEWIIEARYHNPQAKLVIDSVDVHFKRLHEKAKITGNRKDFEQAEKTRKEEVLAYNRADFILAVTEADQKHINHYLPKAKIALVPNIHRIHSPDLKPPENTCRLVFVGGFQHSPNIDAVLYFCREILPRIALRIPVETYIIGSNPPPEICNLHSDTIIVTGHVEDTLPYLKRSHISIAPLRYGAGMKGKIGEAMAAGLPVVTTSVGAEGFGFTPGKHILIGDTPEVFAKHIVNLYKDPILHETIRLAGWNFIRKRYSEESLRPQVIKTFESILASQPKPLPWRERLTKSLQIEYERHLAWRFRT
ncbi:O-antigen biosynthesis protein [Methylomarinovum tepidoasis]|uniref:O-antigen biosynthesis protein n=1 Tax=Methylomarinovum tepidoasis TaxID=2840183 RepID=A0AAU9CBQ7_9GAMM|nr:glycosyltransferase [Methylomarinovum sp. IN45]BCX89351.1 O-antigen biosynthesis protein [Methylomarinovum sp. IN45]